MTPTPEHEDRCHICQKLKGQPPDRCPGHYQGTASDPMLSMTAKERGTLECRKIDLCVLMHETYETAAKEAGWKTQESCRVDFKDLPQANKLVMLRTAEAVLEYFHEAEAVKDAEIERLHMERNAATLIANAAYEAVREQLAGAQAVLRKIADPDWVNGGGTVGGNENLPGNTGEFYKGYNAGRRTQFEKAQRLAEQALAGGTEALDRHDAEKSRTTRQKQVAEWVTRAFGTNHAVSVPQRAIRLLEEAVEAYQSAGAEVGMAHSLVDYVFSKEPGALNQEIGGVGTTLLALANAAGLDADEEERRELDRVLAKPLEHFRSRNTIKNEAGFFA